MAYDKVVDSAILDSGLKQIADAIREKGGTSDSLAFPTAMAEAIAAIEAGNGGDVKITGGSFTITTYPGTTTFTLEHGLGSRPWSFAIVGPKGIKSRDESRNSLFYLESTSKSTESSSRESKIFYGIHSTTKEDYYFEDVVNTNLYTTYGIGVTDTSIIFDMTAKNILLVSGYNYRWVAFSKGTVV